MSVANTLIRKFVVLVLILDKIVLHNISSVIHKYINVSETYLSDQFIGHEIWTSYNAILQANLAHIRN